MGQENNTLREYHWAQCFNLIKFLRHPNSTSPKFPLDFLDEYLTTKLKGRVKNPSMAEGMHVWITNEIDRVYFETYYIHPHNGDENGVEDGSLKIDDELLKAIRSTLMKMARQKVKEEYEREIKVAEHNKAREEKNRIEYAIDEIVLAISLDKQPSTIFVATAQHPQNDVWQLCEDLRNDWDNKATFLEQINSNEASAVLRICISDLFRVQSKLKESK